MYQVRTPEVERALLVHVLHPVEAEILLADHEPGRVGHLARSTGSSDAADPGVPDRIWPATPASRRTSLSAKRHTQPRNGVGTGVRIAHGHQRARQVALLLVAQAEHVRIAEVVDRRGRLQARRCSPRPPVTASGRRTRGTRARCAAASNSCRRPATWTGWSASCPCSTARRRCPRRVGTRSRSPSPCPATAVPAEPGAAWWSRSS